MKRGVHAILYAYFDSDEQLDRRAMRHQIDLCLSADIAGIAALGLATEVSKLSFDERSMLMDWVGEDLRQRAALAFTIYGQSVAEQVAMVRRAERAGANWLILQPPSVGNYPAEEYLSFFGRVMDATALPVAIQNAPQYLGRGLSDSDIDRLRQRHKNFMLIKAEASASDAKRLKTMAGTDFKVFNGRGGLEQLQCLDGGCDGFLLAPDLVDYSNRIMKLHDSGEQHKAANLYSEIEPGIAFLMRSIEHLICYGKRLFAMRAGLQVFDRAPALRPDAEELIYLTEFARKLEPFPLSQEKTDAP